MFLEGCWLVVGGVPWVTVILKLCHPGTGLGWSPPTPTTIWGDPADCTELVLLSPSLHSSVNTNTRDVSLSHLTAGTGQLGTQVTNEISFWIRLSVLALPSSSSPGSVVAGRDHYHTGGEDLSALLSSGPNQLTIDYIQIFDQNVRDEVSCDIWPAWECNAVNYNIPEVDL